MQVEVFHHLSKEMSVLNNLIKKDHNLLIISFLPILFQIWQKELLDQILDWCFKHIVLYVFQNFLKLIKKAHFVYVPFTLILFYLES